MNARVTKRYAKALYDLAIEQKLADKVYSDMKILLDALFADKQFRMFISNPSTSSSLKKSVLEEALKGKTSPLTLDFLKFIVDKNRGHSIFLIAKIYIYIYRRESGILKATISTAIELEENDIEHFRKVIKGKCNCEVEITNKVIPNLIGGFILKLDGFYIDKSIKNGLNQIKMQLNETVYTKN